MTKPMMDLRALLEKSGDADLLRETIGFAAERLMGLEVGAKTGVDYGEKSGERMRKARSRRSASDSRRLGARGKPLFSQRCHGAHRRLWSVEPGPQRWQI